MGRISTLNVTILAKKIVKIGQLELNIWVFHVAASRFICIYQNLLVNQCFLLQYPAWNISGHHGIIQFTKYDYFSQKNHPDWSTGAENMSFSMLARADLFVPLGKSMF